MCLLSGDQDKFPLPMPSPQATSRSEMVLGLEPSACITYTVTTQVVSRRIPRWNAMCLPSGAQMGLRLSTCLSLVRSWGSWPSVLTEKRAKVLRQADDGLPQVSTETIGRVLHEAGYSWQADRTWCHTGQVERKRNVGVVTVTDPDTEAKKND